MHALPARSRTLLFVTITVLGLSQGCSPQLKPWHTERLTEEFTAAKANDVRTFADYQRLEQRLFGELAEKVYAQVGTGPAHKLVRYSAHSAADPRDDQPDWNRSFELSTTRPVGGVLLLHGMSDSPYALRALGEALNQRNYLVLGMRMPGHGTAPSGLRYITRHDMSAAVRLGMRHLAAALGDKPIHIVGYSTGAALAVEFALDALRGSVAPVPATLVLISPAVRIHGTAALASFKDSLSAVPGLGQLAWLQILPEFDPYKYNSFATNAANVVHRLTVSVDRRLAERAESKPEVVLPPVLVFKSTVDATVTTTAVVDNLLALLRPGRHELVLFDINRAAAKSILLTTDPGPLTGRIMGDGSLPFAVRLVTNEDLHSRAVVVRYKEPFSEKISHTEPLGISWPRDVISLSHVALPIPPDDPLLGRGPPQGDGRLFLGDLALRGERGLIDLPAAWQLRMRYNPFYEVLERRTIEWVEGTRQRPSVAEGDRTRRAGQERQ